MEMATHAFSLPSSALPCEMRGCHRFLVQTFLRYTILILQEYLDLYQLFLPQLISPF